MKAKINKSKKTGKPLAAKISQSVKMLVVPHAKNEYRPHLIRIYGIVAVLLIIIGLQFGYYLTINNNNLSIENSNATITKLLAQTNAERVKVGIPVLKLNEKLDQAATLKVQDMFNNQYWAHISPSGATPWKWLDAVDYDYSEAGENLAKNYTTVDSVMSAWMNSPEHRGNILQPDYRDIGFAIAMGDLNGSHSTVIVALYGINSEDLSTIDNSKMFISADSYGPNLIDRLESLNLATDASLVVLALVIVISIVAHFNRHKLPKALSLSWRRHHGAYKAVILIIISIALIIIGSSGRV